MRFSHVELFDLIKNHKIPDAIEKINSLEDECIFHKYMFRIFYYSVIVGLRDITNTLLSKFADKNDTIFTTSSLSNLHSLLNDLNKMPKLNQRQKIIYSKRSYKFLVDNNCPDEQLKSSCIAIFKPEDNVRDPNNPDEYCILDELIVAGKYSIAADILKHHRTAIVNLTYKPNNMHYSIAMHMLLNGQHELFNSIIAANLIDITGEIPEHSNINLNEHHPSQPYNTLLWQLIKTSLSDFRINFIVKLLKSNNNRHMGFISWHASEYNIRFSISNYCSEAIFTAISEYNYSVMDYQQKIMFLNDLFSLSWNIFWIRKAIENAITFESLNIDKLLKNINGRYHLDFNQFKVMLLVYAHLNKIFMTCCSGYTNNNIATNLFIKIRIYIEIAENINAQNKRLYFNELGNFIDPESNKLRLEQESVNRNHMYLFTQSIATPSANRTVSNIQADTRPLRKLAEESVLRGDAGLRTAMYTPVHEDSNTSSTKQDTSSVEFPKRSIELDSPPSCNPLKILAEAATTKNAEVITDRKIIGDTRAYDTQSSFFSSKRRKLEVPNDNVNEEIPSTTVVI